MTTTFACDFMGSSRYFSEFRDRNESGWEAVPSRLALPDRILAVRDIGFEGFAHARIHRRLDIFFQRLLPQPRRPGRRVQRAGLLPGFVILPVGKHRLIEGGGVALERMRRAKEVATRPH